MEGGRERDFVVTTDLSLTLMKPPSPSNFSIASFNFFSSCSRVSFCSSVSSSCSACPGWEAAIKTSTFVGGGRRRGREGGRQGREGREGGREGREGGREAGEGGEGGREGGEGGRGRERERGEGEERMEQSYVDTL